MNKYLFSSLLLMNTLWAIDVPIEEVHKEVFNQQVSLNSKIVQLSSAKENIMARVGGQIRKYLVKQGQNIKRGQAIAVIESLELSKLSSKLKLLRKQLITHNKNYKILKKLYDTGLESVQNVNKEERERDETISEIESIKKQLSMLGVHSKASTASNYTVYAQGSGKVSKILVPINSVVDTNTPLLSIVKGGSSFLVQSYVPLKYASDIKVGQEGQLQYAGKNYKMHISQILPELDEKTQQMLVLSSLDEPVNNLFVNAYVNSKLSIGEPQNYLAVKKSALSFFNNEWVVFVPKHHDEEEGHEHDEHKEEKHDKHDEHEGHGHDEHKEETHDEHEGHGHDEHEEKKHDEAEEHEGHEEEEVPYDIRVVKIIKQNDKFVAIEGLKEHEDYVSAKSYYIKSLLLKSSLGGHGH